MTEQRVWGPVITVVDAGHVNHHDKCARCAVSWPCAQIVAARAAQPAYGMQVARQRAIAAGALSNTAVV